LKKDFEEYNSRPYQGHSIMPILNLISYAQDERIVTAATMVLDYLSAKFAVQSSQLRRSSPICRQEKYAKRTSLLSGDHLTAIFAQLAGNIEILNHNNPAGAGHLNYGSKSALFAGMS